MPSPLIRAHGDLSGGPGGENLFFHTNGNKNVKAPTQGQAVTYTVGVGRNGNPVAENVAPSSGGGGGGKVVLKTPQQVADKGRMLKLPSPDEARIHAGARRKQQEEEEAKIWEEALKKQQEHEAKRKQAEKRKKEEEKARRNQEAEQEETRRKKEADT